MLLSAASAACLFLADLRVTKSSSSWAAFGFSGADCWSGTLAGVSSARTGGAGAMNVSGEDQGATSQHGRRIAPSGRSVKNKPA